MTKATSMERRKDSLLRDWLLFARYRLGGGRMLLVFVAVAVIGGLTLNWNWLVATGVASLMLALLPCAVMCALGLCAHKLFGASGASERPRRTLAADQTEDLSAPSDSAAINPVSNCCSDAANEAAPVQLESTSDDERRDSNA